MKLTTRIALVAVVALFLCPACGARDSGANPADTAGSGSQNETPPAAKVKAPESITEAMALAKKEGKNLLVEYTSKTCPFCKQMNGQTLNREDVREALTNVVWYRIDQDTNGDEWREKWGARGTPAFVVADAEGKTLHGPVSGMIPAPNFIAYVNWAKTGEGAAPAISAGSS